MRQLARSPLAAALLLSAFAPSCADATVTRAEPQTSFTAPPPLPKPPPPAPQRPPLTRRAQLRYALNTRPFPLPLVTGTIGGQPTLMLVDTATNSHVVAGWFARKVGLPMSSTGDAGSDLRGQAIQTLRIDDARMTIDGWGALAPGPTLASEVPDVIEQLGIGGFISPQQLGEEGDAVVVDLPKGELRAAWWDDAHRELSATGVPLLVGGGRARLCEDYTGPVKGLAFVIPGNVEAQHVDLLLSTGAQHSDVFAKSWTGRFLGSRSVEGGATVTASGRVVSRVVKGAKVDIGAFSKSVDIDLLPGAADSACPRDGVVAMDVLRSCTLLLGRKRVFGSCTKER